MFKLVSCSIVHTRLPRFQFPSKLARGAVQLVSHIRLIQEINLAAAVGMNLVLPPALSVADAMCAARVTLVGYEK